MTNERINECKRLIKEADVLLIGAGAGFSTAAGLEYGGERFQMNFPDYIERYGLTDMYSSAFYPFPTPEERWGYFSRHIKLNRYDFPVPELYRELLAMVSTHSYFVITTNADSLFFRSGFDPERVFASQGDYRYFQCEKGCHDTLYDNKEAVFQMVERQRECRIPSELLPVCPVCGESLTAHLRIDGYFVENKDWKAAAQRYSDFLNSIEDKNLVLLELGVGFNTPGIIRFPFEQITASGKDRTLIRLNAGNVQTKYDLQERAILLQGDIRDFFSR